MSSGDHSHSDLPSKAVLAELLNAKFYKAMKAKPKIDKDHDIPYVAGYSKDGKTVYFDRHLPLILDGVDITPYLLEHEHAEKTLIDMYDLTYQEAHAIATMLEDKLVKSEGLLSVKKYEAHYKPYIRECDDETLTKVPMDLDLTPYEDEHDKKVLKRIIADQKEERRDG
jgi:carboxylesterase type B